MSLTRRDTIKSILAAAAVAAVPAVAEAALKTQPPTKAESIYAKIKELLSRCEAERGLPFDHQWDSITICLPVTFDISDLNATSRCFRMEYPNWRWGGFKIFKHSHCLEVDIFRMVDADNGNGLYAIDTQKCSYATMFLNDGQIISGKY